MTPEPILIPYELTCPLSYEHGFAHFAHTMLRLKPALVKFAEHAFDKTGTDLTLIVLNQPIIAWCLDTNATQHCAALLLRIADNGFKSGLKSVWMIDSLAFATKVWQLEARGPVRK